MLARYPRFIDRRDIARPVTFPWIAWLLLSVALVLFFSPTLTTAVPVWIDETMLVELGHNVLSPPAPGELSFSQMSASRRPAYSMSMLGGILQELAYRVTAPSNFGTRLSSLLGQLTASGALLYFLLLRGAPLSLSWLLSLAFLLDPLCDISWRGARVDAWVMACGFCALILIHHGSRSALVVAGLFSTVGFGLWPSFAMLVPLLAVGAWEVHRARLWQLRYFALGAAVLAVIIVTLTWNEMRLAILDTPLVASRMAGIRDGRDVIRQLIDLSTALGHSPIIVLLGSYALLQRRNRLIALALLAALLLAVDALVTRVRIVYLLPYFYLAIGSWLDQGTKAIRPVLVLALVLAGGFTLLGTTMSGWSQREGKAPEALIEPMKRAVGTGPINVYEQSPDLYFVGRALGWHQFHVFDAVLGPTWPEPPVQDVVRGSDVAIFKGRPTEASMALLAKMGFQLRETVLPAGGHRSSLFGFEYGPPTYGPYFVFGR